jgi:hypothetical protein
MRSTIITTIVVTTGFALTFTYIPAHARSPYEGIGQVEDGEAGYKIGCSAASSLGIPSCGELPSGKKFMPPEEYGPPTSEASPPEQYGPYQEPEPGPLPAPQTATPDDTN